MLSQSTCALFSVVRPPLVVLAVTLCMWCIAASGVSAADSAAPANLIGQKAAAFELDDLYGRKHELADQQGKIVVLAFIGTECPLAKLYAPRLEALHQRFAAREIVLWAVASNTQDSLTELTAFAQRHAWTFPVLRDAGNVLADQLGVQRTPEVVVLDAQHTIRYRGRIDDQYGVGTRRPAPQREDLALAVEQLLAGQEVEQPVTEAVGCFIGRSQRVEPRGEITFTGHVAEIFYRRCVECHRSGEIGPFSLTSYEDVVGWGETIREVIEEQRMPPWNANPQFGHFKNDGRLTDEEKQLIFTWIDNGMPEGEPADLPPMPPHVAGWRMPEPDMVIAMSDKPFQVPAEGVVDYQYFEVDPGFTEDKYVCAAEARPDNRAVVHHIIVYIKAPGDDDFRKLGALDGYAPGSQPSIFENGMARFVPKGSKLVFEMHYTPNGSAQQDCSKVGLKFIEKSQVTKLVHGGLAANTKFVIPPGAEDHEVVARQTLGHDCVLLTLTPHMHLRGKSFRYEARFPDGTQQVLLDVPRYDFNWQLTYELAEPLRLPKGTELICTALFDNSDRNPFNPDPTSEVRWGDQSFEEMMIGFFAVVAAD